MQSLLLPTSFTAILLLPQRSMSAPQEVTGSQREGSGASLPSPLPAQESAFSNWIDEDDDDDDIDYEPPADATEEDELLDDADDDDDEDDEHRRGFLGELSNMIVIVRIVDVSLTCLIHQMQTRTR